MATRFWDFLSLPTSSDPIEFHTISFDSVDRSFSMHGWGPGLRAIHALRAFYPLVSSVVLISKSLGDTLFCLFCLFHGRFHVVGVKRGGKSTFYVGPGL